MIILQFNTFAIEEGDLYQGSVILIGLVSSFFLIVISFLIYTQTQNFLLNKTMMMRFSRQQNRLGKGVTEALLRSDVSPTTKELNGSFNI